jgi:hypothetical protein
MDAYREEAKRKHQEKLERDRLLEEDRLRSERDRLLEEERLRLEREQEENARHEEKRASVLDSLGEWDTTRLGLHEDPLLTLHLLCTLIESTIELFVEMESMPEWEKRVVDMIHELNALQEQRHTSTEDARALQVVMQHMIDLTRVDVVIEPMDTTGDEAVALRMAENEWQQDDVDFAARDLYDDFAQEPMRLFPEQDDGDIPVVSMTRRVGLNMAQLKDMARLRGQKITGTKEQLSMRLAQAGWVRIID